MNKQETVAIKHVLMDVGLGDLMVKDALERIAEILDAREPETRPFNGTVPPWWPDNQPITPLPGTIPNDGWKREYPKDEKVTVTYANDKTGGQAE